MKIRNILSLIICLPLFAVCAAAHPLGNFTINQYSHIEAGGSQIKVRHVLDMAEIPTVQASNEIDTNKDGKLSQAELNAYVEKITPEQMTNLLLSVNDVSVLLRPAKYNVFTQEGSGGLPQLRIEWDLIGDMPANPSGISRIQFENKNFNGRVGWNEIVVAGANGAKAFNSTAFGNNLSDELKTFPQDAISAPLHENKAEFSFTTGLIPDGAKLLQNRDGQIVKPVEKDTFAELIHVEQITPSIILFSLLIAFGLGAVHAMSPGHGKTIVGAYLVGSRGTVKHALFLGLTVTITHTLGVFALGFAFLFLSQYIVPNRVMPFLNFVSGLLVFFIGVTLFKERIFSFFGWKSLGHGHHHYGPDGHTHENEYEADHAHEPGDPFSHTHDGNTHSHLPPADITWKSLLALGISGGLLPCPSALVLMLGAIAAGRVAYGLLLTTVFSLGLATTLTVVGLVFLFAGNALSKSSLSENLIFKVLPAFSALVIACVGAVLCYSSLR